LLYNIKLYQPDEIGVVIIGVGTTVTAESVDGRCDIDDKMLPLSDDGVTLLAVVIGDGEHITSRTSASTMTNVHYTKTKLLVLYTSKLKWNANVSCRIFYIKIALLIFQCHSWALYWKTFHAGKIWPKIWFF